MTTTRRRRTQPIDLGRPWEGEGDERDQRTPELIRRVLRDSGLPVDVNGQPVEHEVLRRLAVAVREYPEIAGYLEDLVRRIQPAP
jgi:hypothetical protein